MSLQLLTDAHDNAKWHGANILQTKIKRGDEFIAELSEEAFCSALLQFAINANHQVLRTKLIVACIASLSRFAIDFDSVGFDRRDGAFALDFLMELPHEVRRMEFSDPRKEARLMDSTRRCSLITEDLCQTILIDTVGETSLGSLEKKAMLCLAAWADEQFLSHGPTFVHLLVKRFPQETAVNTCAAILETDTTTASANVLMDWFAVNPTFEVTVQLLVDLVIQHAALLLESAKGWMCLQRLLEFMAWPGVYIQDEEVSGLVVDCNCWTEVAESWTEMDQPCEALKPLMMSVAQVALLKMLIPKGFTHWSKDDQLKFRLYRRDLADTLDACTLVVGQQVPKALVVASQNVELQEAAFFGLAYIIDKSFSKIAKVDWMDALLEDQFVARVVEKVAYFELLRSMSEYLQTMSDVSCILQLVMQSLGEAKTAPSAALAFCELAKCSSVTMDAPMWLKLWRGVGGVAESEQARVYEALGQVIKRVPGGEYAVCECVKDASLDQILWLVGGMGKGRPSHWQVPLVKPACDVVWQRWFLGVDDGILDDVLKLALECCSTHQHAFPLVETHGLELATWLVHGYRQHPTHAKYLVVVAEMLGKVQREWSKELLTSMAQMVRQMQAETMEEYPDVVYSFFSVLLTAAVTTVPDVLLEVDVSLARDLFCRLLPLGLRVQERLAFTSAVHFVQLLLQQDGKLKSLVDAIMQESGVNLVKEIVDGIAGRAPKSLVPNLAELLCRLLQRYPDVYTLKLAVDGVARVDATAKAEFVKQAMANVRHLKRFKDLVNEFSLKSRGWSS